MEPDFSVIYLNEIPTNQPTNVISTMIARFRRLSGSKPTTIASLKHINETDRLRTQFVAGQTEFSSDL